MAEDILNFNLAYEKGSIITVLGVGGGGCNAVNHMFRQGIRDVDFLVCNTDFQALNDSPVPNKIQLGPTLTEGLGAGNKPEIGKQAAIENIEDVKKYLAGKTKMVFITAGLGGGTGTGATPVIAMASRELGILTVGIVTIPFHFEGDKKIEHAIYGIEQLQSQVDSLLIINNEKLREMYGNLPLSTAFTRADKILTIAAKGIAEIITLQGYINVDFSDVETVMKNSGVALLGSGCAGGKNRAVKAITEALNSPLLNNSNIEGAKNILLNLCSGDDEVRMDEVGQITDYVQKNVGSDTNLIWGTGTDTGLESQISVTIVATGFNTSSIPEIFGIREVKKKLSVLLDEKSDQISDEKGIKDQTEEEKILLQKEIDFEVENKTSIEETDKKNREQESTISESIPEEEKIVEGEKFESGSVKKDRMKKLNIERLKQLSIHKICDPEKVDNIENEPAYKRKNIDISEQKHSEESNVSKYSLFDDPEQGTSLRSDNGYLHDNVD